MILMLAIIAAAAFLGAGYLFGARQGVAARDRLRQALAESEAKASVVPATDLRETLREVIEPYNEDQRLHRALSTLDQEFSSRGELPDLLRRIAHRGGFTSVILSDEVGLPIATHGGAHVAETLAAVSSLLLKLVDRLATAELPAPIGAVFRDVDNQLLVHRVFSVGGERFVLTAVTRARALNPDVLDPALIRIEALLDA